MTTIVIMVTGISLLLMSIWLSPVTKGQQAVQQGELQRGAEYFNIAEKRFDKIEFAKHLFSDAYTTAVVNQFRVLYELGEYEKLLQKAATSPVMAPVHFWTGCALFRRAGNETEAQAQIAWLERASEEFSTALRITPEDWDTKYNYELTERLIAELRDEEESPPQIIEILRPLPRDIPPTEQLKG